MVYALEADLAILVQSKRIFNPFIKYSVRVLNIYGPGS